MGSASSDKVTIHPEFRPTNHGQRSGDGWRLGWRGLASIVVVLILLGWLLQTPASDPAGHADANTVPADSLPTQVAAPIRRLAFSDVPLREAVPGFTDTVTAVIWANHGLEVLQWPAGQPAPETVLSLDHDGGWSRGIDASGRWFVELGRNSTLDVRPVKEANAQSAGPPQPAATGWSAVWHDTRPGWLAWLACSGRGPGSLTALYIADLAGSRGEPSMLPLADFSCEHPSVWLTRWGDWGTLLQMTEGSGTTQVLFNVVGSEIARGRLGPKGEWFVGTGPAGATIWTEGLAREKSASFVLSPDGLERTAVPGLARDERLESALASPDGSLLALVPDLVANYGSVVRIVETTTGAVVAELAEPSWWVTRMAWSTDGRFLLYERWPDVTANWAGTPQDAELVFYDTQIPSGAAFPLPGYASMIRTAPGE